MTSSAGGAVRTAWIWQTALVGALLALSVLAWFVTGWLATPGMRLGLLTAAGPIPSGDMGEPASVAAMGLFLATWVVMMAAMMLPAIAPVVVTFDRWVAGSGRPRSATWLFVAGYLLVWGAAGMVVYAAVTQLSPLLPTGQAAVRAGAVAVMLAGAYQFTPFKDRCLRQCRSPLGFVAEHATQLRRGGLAGTQVGAVHGLFCLGCCWALMLVLVLLGMMSLTWMAAIAGVIFLEKVLPRAWPVSTLVGITLVIAGVALLASGEALPAYA